MTNKERARWCRWIVRSWNKYPMIYFWDFIGDSCATYAYRNLKYDGLCLKNDFAEAFIVANRLKSGISKFNARNNICSAISKFYGR